MKRVIRAMTEEDLNYAIENGKPFDLDTFNKYKIDPYRAEGAVKADMLEVGDIIQVTEDAAEIDCPSPKIEITDIDYTDPDNYGDDCITFYCYDNETGDNYTLHFWPDEWVGPVIARKSAQSVQSATEVAEPSMKWSEMWRPYSGSPSSFTTLYVDGQEVGYVEAWESDGAYGYITYLKSDPAEYEKSLGEFNSLEAAKECLESVIEDTQDKIDTFPVTSSIDTESAGVLYNISWFDQQGNQQGENCTVPSNESPYEYIEHYLRDKYGDDFGGIADYMCESDYIDSSDCINCSDTIRRYSDVRPYEDRRYWYFTTHGVGPGTIPKDLTVIETREGQNDKGTWGTYICLDGVLNTDELDYYDLRELAPQDVTSAEDIEDEWSPYGGHNYLVSAGYDVSFRCDDPKRAITYWFKYQQKYPSDVSIMCPTKDLAIELVKAGTPQFLSDLKSKFPKCPYKLDWLIDECKKKAADGCRGFYEGKYGYGDSVHPFGVG